MYEYLKGEIADLQPAVAVIDCGGVGYSVNISLNTYAAIQGKAETKLYLYEVIREDAHELFGFADKIERAMFILLMSVKGVGANTSRMILSSMSVPELKEAILTGNEKALKSIKGIGLKAAQRIIVELKDKVDSIEGIPSLAGVSSAAVSSKAGEDASLALVSLGYPAPVVRKTVEEILKSDPSLSTEAIIKRAFKMM